MSTTIQVNGLKDNLKILAKINPALRKEIGKEFRRIAQPLVESIEAIHPRGASLPQGFQHNGRTGVGTVKKVSVDVNTRRARNRNLAVGASYETLATVAVRTAKGDVASAIADMAGRKGDVAYGGRSRGYPRRPDGHKLNGQGKYLIQSLNRRFGAPSRFMWRGADQAMNGVELEFVRLVQRVEDELNKELAAIGSSAREVRAQMKG